MTDHWKHPWREPSLIPATVESLRKVQKDTNTFLTEVIVSRSTTNGAAAHGGDDNGGDLDDVDEDGDDDDDDNGNDNDDGSHAKEPVEKIAKLAWVLEDPGVRYLLF